MRNINNTLLDKARTSIFIAHRLRTVVEAGECSCFSLEYCSLCKHLPRFVALSFFTHPSAAYLLNLIDLIIVLKEGKVVEQGTHEELMQEKGLYYSMWLQQASSEGAGNGTSE